MTSPRRIGSTTAVIAMVLAVACGVLSGASPQPGTAGGLAAATRLVAAAPARVVAISLDGLNPTAIPQLGRARLPNLYRMFDEGAYTMNARAQVEQTVTLPNHTSMVTGRRIDRRYGGHGVTWNSHRPGTTVQRAAGHDVSSVFRVVHAGGGSTSVFSTKAKFSLFERSWPVGVDRIVIREGDDTAVTALFVQDLLAHDRAFAFLHLGLADQTGHARGWMGPSYLRAVQRLDQLVGEVLAAISSTPSLQSTVVVLTADHGGQPGTTSHDDPARFDNHRVPFLVWGAGVEHENIYRLNDPRRFKDPGRTRPGFSGAQPIRNGDVANLATDLLGLGPVPGSLWNSRQLLRWHR